MRGLITANPLLRYAQITRSGEGFEAGMGYIAIEESSVFSPRTILLLILVGWTPHNALTDKRAKR